LQADKAGMPLFTGKSQLHTTELVVN
jgi:hypothetical protein